jgi:hypothetical protein
MLIALQVLFHSLYAWIFIIVLPAAAAAFKASASGWSAFGVSATV